MDSKSLAKSKRAHTQHHNKKYHSAHKPKGPGVSEIYKNPEKLQINQTKSPVQSRRISALPSNWDRYDDESEDLLISQREDVVLPKSKGADYIHLISEAKAESQSKIQINSDSLDDDLLHDEFSRVVGSMISVRGEGILSWMEDDNFVVEEDGSASYQEPGFLSLNLNALAKTLEKVDLHERLYIEADVLELCTSQSKVSCDEQVTEAKTKRLAQQEDSSVFESLDQVKDIPILTHQSEKSSAIEADLDLLLGSFSEPQTQPNPVTSVQNSSAFETELDSLLNSPSNTEPFNKPVNPSDQKLQTTGFDDELDDLLESISVSIKPTQNEVSGSSSSSVGKSKVLDDFDSWIDTI